MVRGLFSLARSKKTCIIFFAELVVQEHLFGHDDIKFLGIEGETQRVLMVK